MTEEFEEIDFENVKVTFPDNSTKKYPKPLYLGDLLSHPSLANQKIICLMVNGEVKSINSSISFGIAKVSPIVLDSFEGSSAYRRTLVKVFAKRRFERFYRRRNKKNQRKNARIN